MNKSLVAIGTATTLAIAGFAYAGNDDHAPFSSLEQKESYGIGSMIGQQLKQDVADVDADAFLEGVTEGFGGNSKLDREQISALLKERMDREQEAALAAAREKAAINERAGSEFRDDFAQQDDVVTLESGLQYKVITAGSGELAEPGSTVSVRYRGTFVDGTEFDATPDGEPVEINVDRVIPGWSEALKNMPAGSKWQVVIPPHLAYGEQGVAPIIEPGSTLVFEIELVEVS